MHPYLKNLTPEERDMLIHLSNIIDTNGLYQTLKLIQDVCYIRGAKNARWSVMAGTFHTSSVLSLAKELQL